MALSGPAPSYAHSSSAETHIEACRKTIDTTSRSQRDPSIMEREKELGQDAHLMEVILVQLANERSEIGMLEHPRKDGFRELCHILQKKQKGIFSNRRIRD